MADVKNLSLSDLFAVYSFTKTRSREFEEFYTEFKSFGLGIEDEKGRWYAKIFDQISVEIDSRLKDFDFEKNAQDNSGQPCEGIK